MTPFEGRVYTKTKDVTKVKHELLINVRGKAQGSNSAEVSPSVEFTRTEMQFTGKEAASIKHPRRRCQSHAYIRVGGASISRSSMGRATFVCMPPRTRRLKTTCRSAQ